MSPKFVLLNLVLGGAAVLFALDLGHEFSGSRPLPLRPAPRPAASGAPKAEAPAQGDAAAARPDQRALYGVIASKNLFSPSRTEGGTGGAGGSAPASTPKPFLHGVVLDDGKSRAYLEEPLSKRIFAYAVGDTVGGGRLEAIRADRVIIGRPEGQVEVMLRDPSKPAAPSVPAGQPGAPGVPAPVLRGSPPLPGPTPVPVPAPSVQAGPAAPRFPQSIPPDFLRRPAPAAQPPGLPREGQ